MPFHLTSQHEASSALDDVANSISLSLGGGAGAVPDRGAEHRAAARHVPSLRRGHVHAYPGRAVQVDSIESRVESAYGFSPCLWFQPLKHIIDSFQPLLSHSTCAAAAWRGTRLGVLSRLML